MLNVERFPVDNFMILLSFYMWSFFLLITFGKSGSFCRFFSYLLQFCFLAGSSRVERFHASAPA